MKRRLLLVLLAIVLALLVFWAWRSDLWRSDPTGTVVRPSKAEPARTTESLTDTELDPNARATADASSTGESATAIAEPITIIGHIVDAAHAPVRGARVFMRTPGESWSRDRDAPEVLAAGFRLNAWEAVTQDDGAFRYEVPMPEPGSFELSSASSIHLARLFVQFSRTFGPGTTDLGEFVLDARGAIEGFVRARSGEAVEHAMVASQAADRSTYTDARGRYVLGGVRAGVVAVSVGPMLYLSDGVGETSSGGGLAMLQQDAVRGGIEVQSGATTTFDITLDPAPVLSGRVIDTSGRPVSAAKLEAMPVDGEGRLSLGVSRKDGSFAMRLSRSDPHDVEVTAAGFVRQRLEQKFAETTSDIVIVLVPATQFTFRIIDHASGRPIERFGIGVEYPDDRLTGAIGDILGHGSHPGGEVTLPAAIGLQVVRVAASGYAPLETSVAADPGTSSVQTIRMHAGAIVHGRVLDHGQPLARIELKIQRTTGDDTSEKPAGVARTGSSRWLAVQRSARSDAQGAFRLTRLPAGTWTLSMNGPAIEPRTVAVLTIADDEVIDAGAIEATPGASLVGHLVVPAGRSPANIFVWLDGNQWGSYSDESGSFRFDSVAPGKHEISCRRSALAATGDHSVEVELAAGETKDVTIDLTLTLPAYVLTRVVRALAPVAGATIALDASGRTVQWQAGTTGNDGLADVECPPNQAVQLWVVGAAKTSLGSTPTMTLASQQRVEREIVLVDGTLEVVLPDDVMVPDNGWLAIDLDTSEGRRFKFTARTPKSPGARDADWTSTRIVVGNIAPAQYSVDARVSVQSGDEVQQTGQFACVAVVRAGENTVAKAK